MAEKTQNHFTNKEHSGRSYSRLEYVNNTYEGCSKRNLTFEIARQPAEGARCGYRVHVAARLDNKLPFAAFRSDPCEHQQGTNDEVALHQRENTSTVPAADYQPRTSMPPQGTNDEVAPYHWENTSTVPAGDYQPHTSTPPVSQHQQDTNDEVAPYQWEITSTVLAGDYQPRTSTPPRENTSTVPAGDSSDNLSRQGVARANCDGPKAAIPAMPWRLYRAATTRCISGEHCQHLKSAEYQMRVDDPIQSTSFPIAWGPKPEPTPVITTASRNILDPQPGPSSSLGRGRHNRRINDATMGERAFLGTPPATCRQFCLSKHCVAEGSNPRHYQPHGAGTIIKQPVFGVLPS
uniref:(California timema) hypothetical protein n=1 Tax=Timema californicum TaxID=61474 RepID=A0A7R9IY95_TIMCA|nr:unnamed protein product [Timema californicum]